MADLIGPISHELRNSFNSISLQAAVLARRVPEEQREEVESLRRSVMEANRVLELLGGYRRTLEVPCEPIELETFINTIRSEWASGGRPVEVEMDRGLSPVLANEFDLGRLLRLLISNAQPNEASVRLTIRNDEDHTVVFRIWDDGEPVSPARLRDYFNPAVPPRPGELGLERAACETIVRRLQGKIRPENVADGGFAILVWLAAQRR